MKRFIDRLHRLHEAPRPAEADVDDAHQSQRQAPPEWPSEEVMLGHLRDNADKHERGTAFLRYSDNTERYDQLIKEGAAWLGRVQSQNDITVHNGNSLSFSHPFMVAYAVTTIAFEIKASHMDETADDLEVLDMLDTVFSTCFPENPQSPATDEYRMQIDQVGCDAIQYIDWTTSQREGRAYEFPASLDNLFSIGTIALQE